MLGRSVIVLVAPVIGIVRLILVLGEEIITLVTSNLVLAGRVLAIRTGSSRSAAASS